ncbi:MAG TPA: FAD-binding oxidoreductase [Caulobacteraceae bacterium]|nr:FAD-binding oxidoreductase [Caulobacteraceae bacterium]
MSTVAGAGRDLDCDVAIIGGGGMGSAAAYYLKSLGGLELRVTVFEPDPTYARAATALAAGGIRQQFSTPENIEMSLFGYRFFETIGETLAVDGETPSVGLTPRPYLRLADKTGLAALKRDFELQSRMGAAPEWLAPSDLARRFPWMRIDEVAGAVLGGPSEGMFDPYGMLQAFRRKARALGARYHAAAAVGFERDGDRIVAVELGDGRTVRCGVALNAAGPRAARVAAMAGLELPVQAIKAQSFAFRAARPVADCPIVLDRVQGLQFKPEGDLFVCAVPGGAPPRHDDDFDPEPDLFEAEAWPRLAARVPQFESLRLTRTWVGHIELNTFDANPVLGPHPERPNFHFVVGFSGHGAQHVPAAGRAIAESILFGGYRTLDLSRFGYERILKGEPVREGV